MQKLKITANIASPDDIYESLIRAHDGLAKDESDALNARLILVLMNHIGDETIIKEALSLAKSATHSKPHLMG
jgi:uncharacterized radical SAM superfamily protein